MSSSFHQNMIIISSIKKNPDFIQLFSTTKKVATNQAIPDNTSQQMDLISSLARWQLWLSILQIRFEKQTRFMYNMCEALDNN